VSAQDEIDLLLREELAVARKLLEENGRFYPTTSWIDRDGKLAHQGGHTGGMFARATEILDMLYAALRQKADEQAIRACAVAVDVRVVPPGETRKTGAILVTIEHAEADPVDVVLPYSKPRFRRGIEYGEQFSEPGARKIFLDPS
jgi:hypothetical protein